MVCLINYTQNFGENLNKTYIFSCATAVGGKHFPGCCCS